MVHFRSKAGAPLSVDRGQVEVSVIEEKLHQGYAKKYSLELQVLPQHVFGVGARRVQSYQEARLEP